MTKTIPLTKGFVCMVDADDYQELSQWRWYAHRPSARSTYAARSVHVRQGVGRYKNILVYMHRQILGLPMGDPRHTDHASGDTLDNRRANLRIAGRRQNNFNRKTHGRNGKPPTSNFKGVYWDKKRGKWRSMIGADGKRKNLGLFTSEVQAARAYNEAARILHGSFAKLNDI